MDVLLGEDETLPKNRLALICHHCRLVNGQAPPGVQHLEDVGTWRCAGCGTMNGEETEDTRLVRRIKEQAKPPKKDTHAVADETATVEEALSEASAGESISEEQQDRYSQSSESSESEREKQQGAGETTGAQKGTGTARRRSSRVKRRTKG